jgi:hypothetical protein
LCGNNDADGSGRKTFDIITRSVAEYKGSDPDLFLGGLFAFLPNSAFSLIPKVGQRYLKVIRDRASFLRGFFHESAFEIGGNAQI